MFSNKTMCRIFAVLIALVVVMRWKTLTLISFPAQVGWLNFVSTIGLLFFVFNIAAAIGLFLLKRWGFFVSYIAIAFSTFFFSTPYIPIITNLLPRHWRYAAMLIINIVVVLCIVRLQLRFGGKRSRR